ncbi:response regulator [Noviherbaspirillum aridicola]|uniref:Response regulator n=1 Tax=Noviherbaspirillum aridicola TaxID=2849687 RepID=A0ABQ4Q4A9_9BURK|nr:response regulator [Noviherbaspirillum aridicola]GIZ51989.1 response regulator [Noviherbaspirillum aridicola]
MAKPILLVEDNPHDLELTLHALNKHRLGNEVVVARDGEEALDFLFARGAFEGRPAGLPSLIMLDLKLPKIDGIEVLRTIRTTPALAQLPVVMFTASRMEADIASAYAGGVNSYVVKPLDFQELMRVVADLGCYWTVHNEPPQGAVRPA